MSLNSWQQALYGALKAKQTSIDTDKRNKHKNLFQCSDAREKRKMKKERSQTKKIIH